MCAHETFCRRRASASAKRSFASARDDRRGIAYVGVLLVIVFLASLGFVFISRVHARLAVSTVSLEIAQAEYLAESAVNHAMWRMASDPVFTAPHQNKYYMHSLGAGRYGYKVRLEDDNQFATVATVGAVGQQVVLQSYVIKLADAPDASIIMFVVKNANNPSTQEAKRIAAMSSWGYAVSLVSDGDSPAEYDAVLATSDVVYVSEEISSDDITNKLDKATIGVVNEEVELADELGFTDGNKIFKTRDEVKIVDNTHYITSPFALGWLTYLTSVQDLAMLNSAYAPGMQTLGETENVGAGTKPSLAVLASGAELENGLPAAGRRVHLPYGASAFDFDAMNTNGHTLMRRSIEWASDPAAGLIHHWTFDETAGTALADVVGGQDATLNNMDPATDWVTGKIGGALDFDGVNDYAITDANFPVVPIGTVSFWMKVPGQPSVHRRIFGMDDLWEVRHVTTGTPDGIPYGLVFDLNVSGVNAEFATTTTFGVPGVWYHIAATFNTTTGDYAVYVDGAPHTSGTRALTSPSTAKLSFGVRTGSSNYWIGTLDDLRVYNRILRPIDIERIYELKM